MARDILDYSFARPDPKGIADAGFKGVVRYVSPNSGKNLSAGERDGLRGAGLDLYIVWEWYAQRSLEGYNAGKADGAEAKRQVDALGFPANVKAMAAHDFDATEAQQAAINEYQKGFNEAAGNRGRGAYAGYWVIKRLFEADLIDPEGAWQTYAWSGGQWHAKANLRQVLNGQTVAGGAVDFNEAVGAVSKWPASTAPSPAPAPTPAPVVTDGDYTVKSGDTLGRLASAWGTTVQAIIAANQAKYPNIGTGSNALIVAGWTLSRPGTVAPASVGGQYIVKGGDNLGVLATRWGTTVSAIIAANKFKYPNIGTGSNAFLGAGWVINIPGGGAPNPAPAGARHHLVASGETGGKIAAEYGVSWSAIVSANKGTHPTIGNPPDDHIEAGWDIIIP